MIQMNNELITAEKKECTHRANDPIYFSCLCVYPLPLPIDIATVQAAELPMNFKCLDIPKFKYMSTYLYWKTKLQSLLAKVHEDLHSTGHSFSGETLHHSVVLHLWTHAMSRAEDIKQHNFPPWQAQINRTVIKREVMKREGSRCFMKTNYHSISNAVNSSKVGLDLQWLLSMWTSDVFNSQNPNNSNPQRVPIDPRVTMEKCDQRQIWL